MSTAAIIGIVATSAIGYLLIAGTIWCSYSARARRDHDGPLLLSVLWPAWLLIGPSWVFGLCVRAVFCAPGRLVEWHRNRPRKSRLPRATARR